MALQESIASTDVCGAVGSKNRSLVSVVPVDGGELDKSAGCVGDVGVVCYEIIVQDRAVHVQRWVLGSGKRCVEVLLLEGCGVDAAEAGQSVEGAGAAGSDDEIVVLVL